MHERECKGYISFNRGVNELNRGVNELNRGVNELNRGVNHSVARQGCNLLRAAVTSAVTSQGCCCGNLQIHPLDLGQNRKCTTENMLADMLTKPLASTQFLKLCSLIGVKPSPKVHLPEVRRSVGSNTF